MRSGLLGSMEYQILSAIQSKGGQAHGLAIRVLIEWHTGRIMPEGAVYVVLKRMNLAGLVSLEGAVQHSSGGRPRKVYAVTGMGMAALDKTRAAYAPPPRGAEQLNQRALHP